MRMSVRHARPSSARPFTLIELLVVVSIIAVLASMLLPVLGKARAKAKEVTCGSQLKQIGVAFMMYVDDEDELVPFLCLTHSSSTGCCNYTIGGYNKLMVNYVGNGGVFPYNTLLKCPASKTKPGNWGDRSSTYMWMANSFGGYDMCNPAASNFGDRPFPAFKMRNIQSMSKWAGLPAVLLMDKAMLSSNIESIPELRSNHSANGVAAGANILVDDGSVAWHPYSASTWFVNNFSVPYDVTAHTSNASGGSHIRRGVQPAAFQGDITTMAVRFGPVIGY